MKPDCICPTGCPVEGCETECYLWRCENPHAPKPESALKNWAPFINAALGAAMVLLLQLAHGLTTEVPEPDPCQPIIRAEEGCVGDFLTGSLTCKYVMADGVIVKHGY